MKRFLVPVMVFAAIVTNGCAKKSSNPDDVYSDDETSSADTATYEDDASVPDDATAATGGGMDTPEDPAEPTTTASADMPPSEPAPYEPAPVEVAAAPQDDFQSSVEEPVSAFGTGMVETYTVQKGDTLMKIAFNLYGDIDQWRQIYTLNKDVLNGVKSLRPGQSLKYDKPASSPVVSQNGEPYLIKTGDTLGTISDDVYATPKKWRRIWENNRALIKDPNRIYAGFYLYYQITEEEKQQVEQAKANRLSQAPAVTSSPAMSAVQPLSGGAAMGRAPASAEPAPSK